MQFAKIVAGKVTNIVVAEQDFINTLEDTYVEVTTETIGDLYDGSIFTKPVVVPEAVIEKLVTVTLDKSLVTVGEVITASIKVVVVIDGVEDIMPNNGTYYIPIIRLSDGTQGKFLKVVLASGQGTATFSFNEEGIYVVDADKIKPTLAEGFSITDDIEIIVEEVV